MDPREDLRRRLREYAEQHRLSLVDELGFGVHGIVALAESQQKKEGSQGRSALKAYEREVFYRRERDVYLRLRDQHMRTIRGCDVPQLLGHDDVLWIIEMTVVKRPFVLDFAGAHLDKPVEFSEEVLADWRAEKADQFGKHWPEAQAILRALESLGIFMEDVSPSNIALLD